MPFLPTTPCCHVTNVDILYVPLVKSWEVHCNAKASSLRYPFGRLLAAAAAAVAVAAAR